MSPIFKMKLSELLVQVEKAPAMYLGSLSITRLAAFIDGYLLGTSCESGLSDFQQWVSNKYGIKTSHKWSEIILFFEQDEALAFRRFFEILREYGDLNPRVHQ